MCCPCDVRIAAPQVSSRTPRALAQSVDRPRPRAQLFIIKILASLEARPFAPGTAPNRVQATPPSRASIAGVARAPSTGVRAAAGGARRTSHVFASRFRARCGTTRRSSTARSLTRVRQRCSSRTARPAARRGRRDTPQARSRVCRGRAFVNRGRRDAVVAAAGSPRSSQCVPDACQNGGRRAARTVCALKQSRAMGPTCAHRSGMMAACVLRVGLPARPARAFVVRFSRKTI